MSAFGELFEEWAQHEDGTPYAVTITPAAGDGAWGQAAGTPVNLSCPVFYGSRLIRASDGSEKVSTVTLYLELEHEAAAVLGSTVVIDGSRTTTIMRVDRPDAFGLFGFLVVHCE